jgi:hypothetical protein
LAALTSAERDALPASDFVFPDTRDYPYHDEQHARLALSEGAAHASAKQLATIKRKVKARYPGIKVKKAIRKAQHATAAAEIPSFDLRVPIWKDDARQIVYGVVLVPDIVDSQGDVISKEEIEKAAHGFLIRARKHDVHHSDKPEAVETVESFVAPTDFEMGGKRVLKGSWVMGVHVSDRKIWKKVQKGELDGFSIGGTGERIPVAA